MDASDTDKGVLAVMEAVPELFCLASTDPTNDRLRGINARIREAHDLAKGLREITVKALPRNVCLTNPNVPDSLEIPLTFTMGELRAIAAAIARFDGAAS